MCNRTTVVILVKERFVSDFRLITTMGTCAMSALNTWMRIAFSLSPKISERKVLFDLLKEN